MGTTGRTIKRTIRTTAKASGQVMRMRWFPGILITVLVLFAFASQCAPLYSIEHLAHGLLSRMRQSEPGASSIVLVEVDDSTVRDLGGLTPSRYLMADAIKRLSGAGATVVAIDEAYSAQVASPLIEKLDEVAAKQAEDPINKDSKEVRKVLKAFGSARESADQDAMMIKSMGVRVRVVLPLYLSEKDQQSIPPAHVLKHSIKRASRPTGLDGALIDLKGLRNPFAYMKSPLINSPGIAWPFDGLARKARAIGHGNVYPDADGVVRHERLLAGHEGRLYASLALRTAMRYRKVPMSRLSLIEKKGGVYGLTMDGLTIPVDDSARMPIGFSRDVFPAYSFGALIANRLDESVFRGKVVLVGQGSTLASKYRVPFGPEMSALEIRANALDNILTSSFISRPAWAFVVECALIIYFGFIAAFIMPRVRLQIAGLVVGLSVLPIMLAAALLFVTSGIWLMVYSSSVVLVLGYAGVLGREFVVFGNRGELMREHIEANRMLGLELQSRGMLDMALEKFMKCPVSDPTVKELLYNLALDFERKRMVEKAVNVYDHVLKGGAYRDVAEKREVLIASSAATGTGFGGSLGGRKADGTLVSTAAGAPLSTLGRYEVIREIGRGAMGVVYLGRDPKINREMAIKTLLYDDIEPDQLGEIKRRFFQEAEAAGKLSHPNILTIYDAGEEHDMAYLAMEVLEGVDLKDYCTEGHLLEIADVLRIIADTADALDYAHKNGVVHRDIKPANIMLLDDGTVKVTDFGIARVVESSKTQTGMVLGTPSYMSPEQVSGKKVDGRSDLFSLGATMYEMLTGVKAFTGDTITGIMYNITNSRFTPIEEVDSDLPPCVEEIVARMLNKALSRRYRSGADVAKACHNCIESL